MIYSLYSLFLIFTWFSTAIPQRCSRIVIRREIRDLSRVERTRFFRAVNKLHSGRNIHEKYTRWHIRFNNHAHKNPIFLPWHRQFIYLYEKDLQRIDPRVVLPYWDWTRDSQAPEKSIVFSNRFFGGNGRGRNRCLMRGQGPFGNWKMRTPRRHCLRRDFNQGKRLSPFYAPEMVEAIIRNTDTFDDFRHALENGPHAVIHNNIGGRKGDLSKKHSPNDPIFFLHHAFVDLLWNEWQLRSPSLASTYHARSGMRPANVMRPFNVHVRSTFKTTRFCYRYPRFRARLPKTHQLNLRSSLTNNDSTELTYSLRSLSINNNTGKLIKSPRSLLLLNLATNNDKPSHSKPQTKIKKTPIKPHRFKKLNSFIQELNTQSEPDYKSGDDDDYSDTTQNSDKSSNDDTNVNSKMLEIEPISDEYIKNNNLSRSDIRSNEKLMRRLLRALNNVPEFTTRASLSYLNRLPTTQRTTTRKQIGTSQRVVTKKVIRTPRGVHYRKRTHTSRKYRNQIRKPRYSLKGRRANPV